MAAEVRPRRRRRILWVCVAGLCLAAVVVGFVPSFLGAGFLERVVRSKSNAPFRVEKASFSWLGEQRVEGLRLGSPAPGGASAEPAKDRPLLEVATLTVRRSLFALLWNRDDVSIAVESPVLFVARDASGRFNFEDLLEDLARAGTSRSPKEDRSKTGGTKPTPEPTERGIRGLPIHLDAALRAGRLVYRDAVLGVDADLEDVEATIDGSPKKIDARFALRASGGGTARGELSAQGLGPNSTTPEVKGSVNVANLDLRPFRGLLERAGGLTPPEKPLNVELTLQAAPASAASGTTAAPPVGADAASAGDPASAMNVALDLKSELADVGARGMLQPDVPGVPFHGNVSARTFIGALGGILGKALGPPARIGPDAQARLVDLQVDGLARSGSFLKSLRASGGIELVGPVEAHGVRADNLHAKLTAESGLFTVEGLDAALGGGRATAQKLTLDLRGESPAYSINLQCEKVPASYDLAPLLAYAAPFLEVDDQHGALAGSISATLELDGQGFDQESLRRALKGKGSLRIADGKINGSRVFGELTKVLGSVGGANLTEVLFEQVGSDFTIGSGQVEASKVFFVGREGSKLRNLGLSGRVGLDHALDFGVDLGALQETVGDKKLQRILKESRRILGDKGLPLRLKGSLEQPRLDLDVAPGAQGLLDELLKSAGQGSGKEEDAGAKDSGLDDLLDLFKKPKKDRKK